MSLLRTMMMGGGAPSGAAYDPLTALFGAGEIGALWRPWLPNSVYTDTTRTTPAAPGDPVAALADHSSNGWHLSMDTPEKRPLYMANGDDHFLLFDGVDDGLDRLGISGPHTADYVEVMAFEVLNYKWVSYDILFVSRSYNGGNSGTNTRMTGDSNVSMVFWVSHYVDELYYDLGKPSGPFVVAKRRSGDTLQMWFGTSKVAEDSGNTFMTHDLYSIGIGAFVGAEAYHTNMRFRGGLMRFASTTEAELLDAIAYFETRP